MHQTGTAFDRRRFLQSFAVLGGGAALAGLLPGWARAAASGDHGNDHGQGPTVLSGEDIRLTIGHTPVTVDGVNAHAVT
ncbi:MAG TPA: copper resistance system multicopper oxidase, partial [Caulobacter sp.]|nr:copper resistance system multicopper oxidase [Caulobacter sp.]